MKLRLLPLILLVVILLVLTGPASARDAALGARSPAPGLAGPASSSLQNALPAAPHAPNACSTPVTQNIRGKNVDFDQCYERNFSYGGTNYTIHVFYTETNSATNTSRCNATENAAGRCEHAIADNDDSSGNNVNAVAMGAEVERAMRFYVDRNLQFLPPGITTLNVYIAEDPRAGGTPTTNSMNSDDEWVDNNDTLQKRLLAFHEIQHLVQENMVTAFWNDFYGEGIARAIEDRVDTALDADTGHLFIPEVNGILSSDANRSSDLSTISYRSVLWWTWIMDQYRSAGETDPVLGWPALRDFYLKLSTSPDQLTGLRGFLSDESSSFRKDFTDYTLAMYASRFNPSDPRLAFLDTEINAQPGLSGHSVLTTGPAFGSSTVTMNPRSSRYWEFNPASQCDFIGFSFDGNGKPYSFSVMTVAGGNLQKRWTSYSKTWSRTVSSTGLDRVIGVITAIDDSGNVNLGRGCVTPSINIKDPTTAKFEMVGTASNPRNFIVRLKVTGVDGSAVAGLVSGDFQVQLRKAGGGPLLDATVLSASYVQDDYWLLVSPPKDTDGAQTGEFYDLIASLGSASDSEASAVLYVPRSQDMIVVLDRSGSMGGMTGKIEAARNAANLLVNELADTDQGGYVAFDTDADLRQPLAQVNSGPGSHRQDLEASIAAEVPLNFTSIGDGMLTAANEQDAHKNPANMCSFVLLSDGYENEPQFWADVKPQVVDNGCAIHAVGLGPEANEVLLQQIAASVPGGSYDYADSSGSVPLLAPDAPEAALTWQNNLSKIYDFKAAQIAGRQRLQTEIGRSESTSGYKFYVDKTSNKLVISIAWQYDSKGAQQVKLIDPNGNPVVPSSGGLAPSAVVRRVSPLGTNEVWEVEKPVEGYWSLQISQLFQEYFVGVSAESLFEMYLFTGTPVQSLSTGVQVPILVTFVGPGGPVPGADVNATVRDPSGILRSLHLFDDGNHNDGEADDGVYANLYSITTRGDAEAIKPTEGEEPPVVGSYLVNAVGVRGDLRREAQASFALENGPDTNGNRIPDNWEKFYGVSDPGGDPDHDKLSNFCEYEAGTDPRNSDTDGGGESDGSEVPQCYVDPLGQDPFNPADDRVGRLGGLRAIPQLDLKLVNPIILLQWSHPDRGNLLYVDIYRRVYTDTLKAPGPWEQIAAGFDGSSFQDSKVQNGFGYQYQILPYIDSVPASPNAPQAIVNGPVEESEVVIASTDPYPPSGSVLIDNGAEKTTLKTVTLNLSADDQTSGGDGGPVQEVPGTPVDQLEMRLSNSPDFSAASWQPFQPVVTGWSLGDPAYGSHVTVYVQFRDKQGNISASGMGLQDSILYEPVRLLLPLVDK